MARSRRAPSSSARAAPPPARTAPNPSHQSANNTHQSAQSTAPPQVTNVYMQRSGGMGGGMGSGLLGTMASVAAGSVIGHGVSNMLFSKSDAPTQPAQAQEIAHQVGDGTCGPHIKSYTKCLEANEGHADNCKWAWDYFVQCQNEQNPQQ